MFIPPLPPNFGRKPGRPSKLRKRGIDEIDKGKGKKKSKKQCTQKLRRFQTTIHCAICHGAGHNALFCPQLPASSHNKREKLFENARRAEDVGAGPSGVDKDKESDHIDLVADILQEGPEILPPRTQIQQSEDEIQATEPNSQMYGYDDAPNSAGPSMHEQLDMGNEGRPRRTRTRPLQSVQEIQASMLTEISRKKDKAKKKPGVKLRVPPSMTESDILLSQSSVCGPILEKNIIVEGKKKFLDLSNSTNPAAQ